MMHVRSRLACVRRSLLLGALTWMVAAVLSPVFAADPPLSIPKAAPKDAVQGEVEVDIDLNALLDAPSVFPAQSVTDDIWQITAGPGRILVRVPLLMNVSKGPVDLSEVGVKLRGARFLAWHLVDDKTDQPATTTPAQTTEINPVGDKALPVNVPRFAKSITLSPDGTVSWKLDRVIFNASVPAGQGWYKLKLSREALEAMNPGAAPRIVRNAGENANDFQRRKNTEEAEWRRKAVEYRDIAKVVLKLPDEFKGPAPKTLWAVYETRSNLPTLDFDGPEPLPWEFPLDLLQTLQAAVGTGGAQASTGLTIVTATPADHALKVFTGGKAHLYSLRLLAMGFTRSKLLEGMKVGDSNFKLVDQLLAAKDARTSGILMKYLAVNPSEATAALMAKAMQAGILDVASQLAAVQGMLSAKAGDPAGLEASLSTINTFLIDPQGPPPAQLLPALVESAKANTTLAGALVNNLQLEKATDARFAQIVHAVIELAPHSPVAGEWLNTLMGIRDEKKIFTVADLLNKAVLVKAEATPEAPAPATPTKSPGSGDKPALKARIPVLSTSHNLFTIVQNNNPQIRAMAWAGLRHFLFDMDKAAAEAKEKWARLLLDIAIAQTPTPPAVVEFLSRHQSQPVDDALIQIVLRGDDAAAKASAQAMLGSHRALDQALKRMPSEKDRYQFGLRVYESILGQGPYATGLLLDKSDSAPGAAWFGNAIADGQLPDASQWVKAYGSETRMIDLVLKNDEVLGKGAVDALVASAGGGFTETENVANQLRSDLSASPPSVLALWNKLRRDVFAGRLKNTSGNFTIKVRYTENDPDRPGVPLWRTADAGKAEIKIEGANVTLGQATAMVADDEMLSIRLKSAEVGKLPGDIFKSLPLVSLTSSVDMVPLSNGGWLCEFELAQKQQVQLIFTPAKP
ncbi:MAG: hypothetical protein WD768_14550 [Phycisphaeraceae bacterium]